MEDPKPHVQTQTQNLTPPTAIASKKRPHDNANIENSNYFKMRVIVKELRPNFLEVLRTPDFQNCKAAQEIGDKMKLFMQLYKEMTAETTPLQHCQNASQGQPLNGEIPEDQKPREPPYYEKPSEEMPAKSTPELHLFADVGKHGTYIVGGSAFGWNFITFTGSQTIYYGRTKEAFRAANPLPK